jgi:DNA-binding SARP family transcriptional activator/tetratricopeptide (TPR) repeat protein
MPRPVPEPTTQRPVAVWRLELLGTAKLLQQGRTLEPLERRAALLFAYLALEGPTSRAKLAGLIWSDSTEEAARANLRQRLKRLKNTLGAELIVPEEILRLRPDLEVDVIELESLTFTGEYAKAMLFEGNLLANLESDDSPELSEWLNATRERLQAAQREALVNESERLETSNITQALELALRLLERDVLSEDAYQRVMRLQYLRGDRSSALKTFERLKTTLERELGVTPLPQTLELLRVIERGETTPQHVPKAAPMTLQRPPVLVGREHEWAQLEAAWEKGQMILLTGEAGAGKTRLAMDFLASKGKIAVFEGRPGDALVSYSTNARIHRKLITDYDTLKDMPDWVKLELSRILPELGTPPHPIQNEADKLRFYQAKTEACLLAVRTGINIMLLDDLQFVDNGTFESGIRMWGENVQSGLIKGIITYREAELNPFIKETLQQSFDAGLAVQIKLSPLESNEVQTMLESLGVEGLEKFGATMHKVTGGNPMFVLETARTLVTNGALEQQDTNIPLPASVSAAIQARLSKLSAVPIRLARVASVAGTDFSLELAASVLESHVLDLTDSINELENAQVMKGLGFVHDLIAQTTLEGLPSSIRTLLHERVAVYLEKTEGSPARIAHHWLCNGQAAKAVPHMVKAAENWLEQGVLNEAAMQYRQAARIAESFDEKQSFDLYVETLACMIDYEFGSDFEDSLSKIFELARDAHQLVVAYDWKAELASLRGNHHEAIAACDMALQYAIPDSEEFAMILHQKQSALANIGQVKEALDCLLFMEKIYTTVENNDLVTFFNNLGLIYHKLGRHQLAQDYQKRSIEMQTDQISRIRGQNSYLISHVELGEIRKVRDEILAIWLEFKDTVKESRPRIVTLTNLAVSSLYISEMKEALSYLEEISLDIEGSQFWKTSDYHRYKGMILFELGQFEIAQTHLQTALEYGFPMGLKGSVWLLLARCAVQINQEFQESLQNAEKLMVESGDRRLYRQFQLMNAEFLPPKKALKAVQEILKEAEENDVHGSEITAHTRCAQAYLSLKHPKKALKHMEAAATLLLSFDSNHIRRNEIMLTHCQVLLACKHTQFLEQLQKTLNWLLEVADQHVPLEYRESYLTRNPHNAAILELARKAGFIVQIESANVSV